MALLDVLTGRVAAADDLLQRAQHGDGDAFRELFERHARGVHRLLVDLLRDESAADEATQETFVRAHEKLGRLRAPDRLMPWLLGIARNVAFEHLRRARRTSDADAGAETAAHGTPETLLLGAESDALLAEALELLSPERRCALLLRLDHGLPYEDIADAMGWSLQKVKNEIHRARLKLRETLAPHLELRR